MTAHAAVQGIRKVDSSGTIAIFGAENDAPYKRPPLSKGLWVGDEVDSVVYKTADLGAELHLGTCITRLLPKKHAIMDSRGAEHTYERLLIATGARPRRLPFGGDDINYYRTLDDYRRLREDVERHESFAVIGGGFIGSEIAAALAKNGQNVTMIFPEAGISSRVFPPELADHIGSYFASKGVEVIANAAVTDVRRQGDEFLVKISREGRDGDILVHRVVAGIGVVPNVELADDARIQTENGIIVDEFLRTTAPDVFAAGDIAAFTNPTLGKRMRVEHEDNAKTMGRMAGQNMAGASLEYDHLPFFYSDLFDLGYEAVGEVDSRLETLVDWKEPYKEGVVYYLDDTRVRGILLWNVWGQVPAARRLIAAPGPFSGNDLRGRLPEAK
jgi:NADPH-dependent 2,4-dienoyl-CoA reductase/sulfur reductase-like enzyme